jgi:NEDD8-activating enzyme E1 regulatory subunit
MNIDGAATELLKNLILAGVGFVSLIDEKKIDQQDLKENFFLSQTDLNKNRAEICLNNLLQLNPNDVKGNFYIQSPEDYLNDSKLEISTFDILIVTNKQDAFNHKIISLAEKNNQRVIIVRNFGLINYIRLYENYHGSFQLRLTDRPVTDLRIASAFSELKSFSMGINLDCLDEMKHRHVPYVVLLIQALEKYKQSGRGNPSSSGEKKEFLEIINSMRKFKDEENFDEAVKYYYYANKDKCNLITSEIEEIFELLNENCLESLIKKSNVIMSNFFVLCKALQNFYLKYNSLPVVGNLEDMTSDTETYIILKKM